MLVEHSIVDLDLRSKMDTHSLMKLALEEAKQAYEKKEVPVGAVLYDCDKQLVIARAHNLIVSLNKPYAHAEFLVMEAAIDAGYKYLDQCDLYVTLEPCAFCASAIALNRVKRVYYGAYDPKSGGVDHGPKIYDHTTTHHKPDVYGGILEIECAELLKEFFQQRR